MLGFFFRWRQFARDKTLKKKQSKTFGLQKEKEKENKNKNKKNKTKKKTKQNKKQKKNFKFKNNPFVKKGKGT